MVPAGASLLSGSEWKRPKAFGLIYGEDLRDLRVMQRWWRLLEGERRGVPLFLGFRSASERELLEALPRSMVERTLNPLGPTPVSVGFLAVAGEANVHIQGPPTDAALEEALRFFELAEAGRAD
ncbi:MAG TPA: hypothetical protein VM328_04665 [Fimbriimonadaceae bacterium]|nr:hypothetical protein [Fimbriimonadaceae bacterium]